MAPTELVIATGGGDDGPHRGVPRIGSLADASPCEASNRGVRGVHQEALDVLSTDVGRRGREQLHLVRVEQHLRQHDVVALGQIGADHRQRGGTDERPSAEEVFVPPSDHGPQHVDVAVQRAGVLGHVAPGQRRFPDPGRTVEMDQPAHRVSTSIRPDSLPEQPDRPATASRRASRRTPHRRTPRGSAPAHACSRATRSRARARPAGLLLVRSSPHSDPTSRSSSTTQAGAGDRGVGDLGGHGGRHDPHHREQRRPPRRPTAAGSRRAGRSPHAHRAAGRGRTRRRRRRATRRGRARRDTRPGPRTSRRRAGRQALPRPNVTRDAISSGTSRRASRARSRWRCTGSTPSTCRPKWVASRKECAPSPQPTSRATESGGRSSSRTTWSSMTGPRGASDVSTSAPKASSMRG